MPRQPRYFVSGIPQHVVQRGVDRKPVFIHTEDFELYRNVLANAARRFDCQIHAYVLMTNHTHMLITPGSDRSIPLLMQGIGRNYVQRFNERHERTGTLWEGRYRASLVQDDRYLLACHRYIEINPVRAGLVSSPGEYRFSSFGHNAAGRTDRVLTPHAMYLSLARTPGERQMAYRKLFVDALHPDLLEEIRVTTNACRVLGDDRFKDQIEHILGRSVRPRKRGRPRRTDR